MHSSQRLRSIAIGSLSLLFATAAFAADDSFERTLTLTGAPSLSVSTGSGYIHVFPGADGQVHVIGRVHSNPGLFSSGEDSRVHQIVASPPISQTGGTVTIGSDHADSDLFHNISIDYEITAPASTVLRAHAGSGSLTIGGIQGPVTADSGSGRITVDNVGGNSHFSTGSGSIHATHIHGQATAETGSGAIELSTTAPGDVEIKTGSGSIHASGIVGSLRASAGSGSLDVQGNPTSEWRLQSGSGSIHLQVDPAAHFNLNASTGSGSINVDRPIVMQGSLNKHHVTGSINGGGPTVRASTGSGSITMQ